MNYQKIETCNIGNGLGFRLVLWVSGCRHRCKGCHNQETWDFNGGNSFTEKQEKQIIKYLKPDYIKGITLSGGDPLDINNYDAILDLCKKIKNIYPNKDIWCYTGYSYEELKEKSILNYIDVLIDGEFELDKRDITLAFRGSSNQRIIDVKKTLATGEVKCLCLK